MALKFHTQYHRIGLSAHWSINRCCVTHGWGSAISLLLMRADFSDLFEYTLQDPCIIFIILKCVMNGGSCFVFFFYI